MAKIIVSVDHHVANEKRDSIVKRVADELGVLVDDVVLVPAGMTVSVVEVPAELTKAREKHEAEQKAKEQAKEHEQESE